jgi:hypothetical protein
MLPEIPEIRVVYPRQNRNAELVYPSKVKSKAIPQRRACPKGERKYSSISLLTLALDRGEWSASRPSQALPPGVDPGYPLDRRLGGPQSWSRHRG